LSYFDAIADNAAPPTRVYTLCFFEPQSVVPQVVLIDAVDDAEALAEAESRRGFATREVWDRHRLVGVIEPAW
jgi:hypothetical protein